MKLKKLFAGVVAAAMIATMSFPAFAVRINGYTPMTDTKIAVSEDGTFTIKKEYTVNPNGVAPDEEFELTAKQYSASNTSITDFMTNNAYKLTFAKATKNAEGTYTGFTATVPKFENPGVFVYELKETDNATAGVTYDSNKYYLTVYAFQKSDSTTKVEKNDLQYAVRLDRGLPADSNYQKKVDDVKNAYDAEPLTITKTVNGNMGNRTQNFTFKVEFKAPTGKTVKSTISVAGDHGEVTEVNGGTLANNALTFNENSNTVTAMVTLKHGQTITFTNLPKGVSYTVEETNVPDGYKTYITGSNGEAEVEATKAEGSIADSAVTVNYENVNGDSTLDTGVILDNAPYILMLAVVAAGAMTLVIKKRREEE